MKKLYILIFVLSITSAVYAQVPLQSWGNSFGGSFNDRISASCTDPAGNLYVGGSFMGAVDFDPSGGSAPRTGNSTTVTDAFIAKFNSAGVFQWVTTFGGTSNDGVKALAADASGVYATGYFGASVDFDPDPTTTSILTSAGDLDAFVVKYAIANGGLISVNVYGSSGADYGTGLSLDAGSNIYVAGTFHFTVDFDPSITTHNEISWGDYDIFLAKYNSAGAYVWSLDIGSTAEDISYECVTDGSSVWVGGYYSDTFYPDPSDYSVTLGNLGDLDGYIGQYDAVNGAMQWFGSIRSVNEDYISNLAIDATSIYSGGQFSGTATMYGESTTSQDVTGKGLTDGFVARHTIADRKLQWINPIGGTNNDYVDGLVADGGSVYVAGTYSSSMDVDPSAGTVTLAGTPGTYDAYFVKYNYILGSHVTNFSIGASGDDEASTITLGGGNIYYTGLFDGQIDLDPSGVVNSKLSVGDFDSFITRFSPVEPTLSPTSLSFSNITGAGFTGSFVPNGFNDGYIAIYNIGSAPTAVPVDGGSYNPGEVVGGGTGNVLYVGPSPVFTVSFLVSNTNYFVSVYSYNGSRNVVGTINYKTTSPATNSVTTLALATEPTGSPTTFVASALTATSYTASYTAPSPAAGGYIAVRATGVSPDTDPADGVAYTIGNTLGNGVIAYVGPALTFNETGRTGATTYNYKVYSYNGGTGNINYRKNTPASGTVTTLGVAEPTTQPTSLVFSSITSTTYSFSYNAAVGSNIGGYIGIRKAGSYPTFVPTDGVALTAGTTNADNSVVAFVGTSSDLAWNTTSAAPGTRYYLTIYSLNGSGTTINYLSTLPLKGHVTTSDVIDTTPPVLTDNTPTTVAPDAAVTVSVNATDAGVGLDRLVVEYYPINDVTYGSGDLVLKPGTTNTYEYTIPASFNTEQGVEYQVTAYDFSANEGSTGWKSIVRTYPGDGLTIPYNAGTAQTNYRIISVPLDLQKKTVADVFADDLGDYDKTKYRVFRYSGGNTTELSAAGTIEIGKGYWFIAAQSTTVDSGPGTTLQFGFTKPYTISIANGWNQVGNPFNFDLTLSWITAHADNADKTFGAFKTFETKFNAATTLRKMSGGFLMVQAAGDGKLRIPAYDETGRTVAPAPPVNFAQALGSETWGVDLIVKSGDVENTFAGFGMHPKAGEQNDIYDDFTLPRFMEYLELNYSKKLYGSAFTKDVVPNSTEYVWEFNIASNLPDDVVELRWDNSYFGSTDLQLVLWDVEQQRAIDMKTEKTYTFDRSQTGAFKIFFGDESFVKKETLPFRAVFHSASPVPSAGNVTFAFSLPEAGGQVNTNLSVYNLMGQKVAKLVDEPLAAGYQQAVWNIEDGIKPAAGVYISILKFGDTTLQKRLIIK